MSARVIVKSFQWFACELDVQCVAVGVDKNRRGYVIFGQLRRVRVLHSSMDQTLILRMRENCRPWYLGVALRCRSGES